MTMTEALEIVRHLSPSQARNHGMETADRMLRSVCEWRSADLQRQRDKFGVLLKVAGIGPAMLTPSEANLAVLTALRERAMTSEELRVTCEITTDQLNVAIFRLRKDGYDINLVSTGRNNPRRFSLEPETP